MVHHAISLVESVCTAGAASQSSGAPHATTPDTITRDGSRLRAITLAWSAPRVCSPTAPICHDHVRDDLDTWPVRGRAVDPARQLK